MLRFIEIIFGRYMTGHLAFSGNKRVILKDGARAGHIDVVELRAGRLRVAGWVHGQSVTLVMGGAKATVEPSIRREDVAAATSGSPIAGFDVAVPCSWETIRDSDVPAIIVRYSDAEPSTISIPEISRSIVSWKHWLRFMIVGVRCLPDAVLWRNRRDLDAKLRIKRRLGLDLVAHKVAILQSNILRKSGTEDSLLSLPDNVTVIIPVYNAFEILEEVLRRVVNHTGLHLQLIVVEDRSSDQRVRPFLRDWHLNTQASRPDIEINLIENAANLGFIGSVNRGFEAYFSSAFDGPVVLLNSDAFVPKNWIERLLKPIVEDETVGSVTPMSNDAEIFSVPTICRQSALFAEQGDFLDEIAQKLNAPHGGVSVPTGVGFCMAIARNWLEKVPEFDLVFGRGYGEEVDWCQKVRQIGGRHVAAVNLFVEHRGGSSFGSAEKLNRIRENNAIVASRYPTYDAEIQAFISSDPLLTARVALAAGSAVGGDQNYTPIYIAHSLGGGAEHYLGSRISADINDGNSCLVIRVGGGQRWTLEIHSETGVTSAGTDDFQIVATVLSNIPRKHIIYSCGVGDRRPWEIPHNILEVTRPSDRVSILFHDFFPISPSYTLLASDGTFRGVPKLDDEDSAHHWHVGGSTTVSLTQWRGAWGRLVERADEIVAFSNDSAEHIKEAWPDCAKKVSVNPHKASHIISRVEVEQGTKRHIGVLGNIGFQKGAAVVRDLAAQIDRRVGDRPIDITVVGNIDPNYAPPSWVKIFGTYEPSDLPAIAENLKITHWLIPSIWPETFSFTTHEAIATGLPVICFNLGAQADAVRAAGQCGNVLDLPSSPEETESILDHICVSELAMNREL